VLLGRAVPPARGAVVEPPGLLAVTEASVQFKVFRRNGEKLAFTLHAVSRREPEATTGIEPV